MTSLLENIKTQGENTTKEEIINRWKNLQFLEGLDDYLSEKTAIAFEKTVIWSLNNKHSEEFEVLIFPVIRRVLTGLNDSVPNKSFTQDMKIEVLNNFDPLEVIELFNTKYKSIVDAIADLHSVIDVEVLAATHLSHVIVEYIIGKKIKDVKI